MHVIIYFGQGENREPRVWVHKTGMFLVEDNLHEVLSVS